MINAILSLDFLKMENYVLPVINSHRDAKTV